MEKERKVAIEILEELEDLLEKQGITIPSSDRAGEEGEACIFGSEYYDLEDKIVEILKGAHK